MHIMEASLAEEVRGAARRIWANLPPPVKDRTDLYAFENEALSAVRFLTHCRVHRAYATVERISGQDGVVKPLVLVKAELRLKGRRSVPGQRTVFVSMAPVLVQVLQSLGWTKNWAEALDDALRPSLAKRSLELDQEMARNVEALKGDSTAVAKIQGKAQKVVSEEKTKRRAELAALLKVLLRHGWTEEDVLQVWNEASCREVHES